MTTVLDLTANAKDASATAVSNSVYSGTDSLVVLDKPITLSTIEDPTFSSRTYRIEATVTKAAQ
jgi:ApbE superfamily uncharacterized protein (UPF0280 family)